MRISNAELMSEIAGRSVAIRSVSRLTPAGGPNSKVFPPTHSGGVYASEKRRIARGDGEAEVVDCVLLDSVQSQANRIEEALQDACDAGELTIPLISVDFSGCDLHGIKRVTSLQAPHRIADAILRDSEVDGVAFRESDVGKAIDAASYQNATPLYELCPTALVFGMWDSTGPKGGLGARFARALVSEIVGINVQAGVKTGSRIDPLQIRSAAKVLKEKNDWKLAPDEKTKGAVSPSEINHSNIPPDISETGGVTLEFAEQTTVLSLAQLRRLHFPLNGEPTDPAVDDAGRTVLAALALCGATLAAERGLDLRSRCLLWAAEPPVWEILTKPGEDPKTFSLDREQSIALVNEAVAAAEKASLTWRTEPLVLKPSDKLASLVRKSQEVAAAEPASSD